MDEFSTAKGMKVASCKRRHALRVKVCETDAGRCFGATVRSINVESCDMHRAVDGKLHRFGFTTREVRGTQSPDIVTENDSGVAVVRPPTFQEGSRLGRNGWNRSDEEPNFNIVGPDTYLKKFTVESCSPLSKMIDGQTISPQTAMVNEFSNPHSFVREKSVSIPRSKLIEGLENLMTRKKLNCNGVDFIRTQYREDEGDHDAMHVSIEDIPCDYHKTSRKATKHRKKKPTSHTWRQKPFQDVPTDSSAMSIQGTSGNNNTWTKDTNDHRIVSDRKEKRRLPQISGRRALRRGSGDHLSVPRENSFLHKSWKLAISRVQKQPTDASDVYVSGINIHPVQERSNQSNTSPSPLSENKEKCPENQAVELLQLSFPMFQQNSRRSPKLIWDNHQQMIAVGRPKSVNERSLPRSPRKTKDRFNVDREISDPGHCFTNSGFVGKPVKTENGGDEQMHDSRSNVILRPLGIDTETSAQCDSRNSVSLNDGTLPSTEPSLRSINNMSPKMQGPTSDMLGLHSNSRTDTSVRKEQKGARFRLCKPMFDKEDYEGFQHRKFHRNNKYRRLREKDDGVHFLNVKIGDL